jgi:D-3-phosphoglycerate dehydrogenase / 2-oxoglutarate reductase
LDSLQILIKEASHYSSKALELYNSVGKVEYEHAINKFTINVLVVRLGHKINEDFLKNFPNIRYILSPTTGLDHIDVKHCKKKAIKVISLNDIKQDIKSVSSTAELSLGLIISLIRKIPQASNSVQSDHKWDRDLFRTRQLSNMSIGIIGVGRIGRMVARYSNAIGMKVYGCDVVKDRKYFEANNIQEITLKNLLTSVDIISIHASATDENTHLLNEHNLGSIKKGSYIINTARGHLVCEKTIIKLLDENVLCGYAADVIDGERDQSYMKSIIFKNMNKYNILLTPHIGGCTSDAMEATELVLANEFLNIVKRK